MNKSPLTTIMLVALLVSALLSMGLCWGYISNARELRKLQTEAAMLNYNRPLLTALASEAIEYSKKNPQMESILESAGLNLKGARSNTAPATSKPAAK